MNEASLPRTPEPELMDSSAQVEAYADADFSTSNQWFVDSLVEHYQPRPGSGRLAE